MELSEHWDGMWGVWIALKLLCKLNIYNKCSEGRDYDHNLYVTLFVVYYSHFFSFNFFSNLFILVSEINLTKLKYMIITFLFHLAI